MSLLELGADASLQNRVDLIGEARMEAFHLYQAISEVQRQISIVALAERDKVETAHDADALLAVLLQQAGEFKQTLVEHGLP